MKMFIRFSYHFSIILGHLKSVLVFLMALMVISAVVVSRVEDLPFGEALYFSFITGLTIGYGDIVVKTPFARVIAVLLGLIGMITSGIMVAASLRAVEKSLVDLGILKQS
jgi:voltage-gated potassium channel